MRGLSLMQWAPERRPPCDGSGSGPTVARCRDIRAVGSGGQVSTGCRTCACWWRIGLENHAGTEDTEHTERVALLARTDSRLTIHYSVMALPSRTDSYAPAVKAATRIPLSGSA